MLENTMLVYQLEKKNDSIFLQPVMKKQRFNLTEKMFGYLF